MSSVMSSSVKAGFQKKKENSKLFYLFSNVHVIACSLNFYRAVTKTLTRAGDVADVEGWDHAGITGQLITELKHTVQVPHNFGGWGRMWMLRLVAGAMGFFSGSLCVGLRWSSSWSLRGKSR